MSNQHQKSSRSIKLLLYQVLALSIEHSRGNCCSQEYDDVRVCLPFFDTVIIQKSVKAFLRCLFHAKNEWMSHAVGVYIFYLIVKN